MTDKTHLPFFRGDIQALRGIAIILVLLFHLPNTAFKYGFLGVDVFFVVSGYLITPRIFRLFEAEANLAGVGKNITRFANNRIRRLAPAFAVTVLVFLPLLLLFGDTNLQEMASRQSIAGLFLVGNVGAYKFGGNYFHPGVENPLLHFWSLSVEEQIYIFLPIALLFLYLLNRQKFRVYGKVLIILLFLGSLLLTLNEEFLEGIYSHFFAAPKSFSFYSPITRFWEFAAGSLISFKEFSRFKFPHSVTIKYSINTVFLALFVFAGNFEQIYTLLSVIAATCLLILTNSLEVLPFKVTQILNYFGDRSYSLYLVHLPIFYILILSPFAQRAYGQYGLYASVSALFASLVLSNWLYKGVELRFHQINGSTVSRVSKFKNSRVLPALVVSSVVFSILTLPLIASGFLGVLNTSSVDNPGVDFKKYCVRDNSLYQFPCRFPGSERKGTIVLAGDSHASQYSMVLWQLAEAKGLKLILVGDFGGDLDSYKVKNSVKLIKPTLTIVSKFWKSELLESNSQLSQDLETIKGFSREFVIIGQNPIFIDQGARPGVSLIDILFGFKPASDPVDNGQVLSSGARTADVLIRKLANDSQVRYVDTFQVLCPKGICEKVVDGKSLYIDSNHLSKSGALKLRAEFSKILDLQKYKSN